jgi:hypothetical protein
MQFEYEKLLVRICKATYLKWYIKSKGKNTVWITKDRQRNCLRSISNAVWATSLSIKDYLKIGHQIRLKEYANWFVNRYFLIMSIWIKKNRSKSK